MRTTRHDGVSLTLASSSYSLLPDFSGFQKSYVYTNHCILPFRRIKTKEFHLHTYSFDVEPTDGTIDASGVNGIASIDKETESGTLGGNGHDVYFSSANFNASTPLTVLAYGGNGANGYSNANLGDGGKGGNGGNGGFVSLIFADTYSIAFTRSVDFLGQADQEERTRATKEWLDFCKSTITGPQLLVDDINSVETLISSIPDKAGQVISELLERLNGQSYRFQRLNRLVIYGGTYGVGGEGHPPGVDGLNGLPGARGSYEKIRMSNQAIRNSRELLFHPDQVVMTIRDIENYYFLGDPKSLKEAGVLLRTLISRLSFLPLSPTDPLFQAYAKDEAHLFVLPSDDSTPTSISSFNQSLSKAKLYQLQLSQGLDFYGHAGTWVPQGAYSFYQTQLEIVSSELEGIEQNYEKYKLEAAAQAQKRDAIQQSQTTARAIVGRTENEMAYCNKELENTADLIALLSPGIAGKYAALTQAIQSLKSEIQNAFSVSFPDFVNVVTQMAYTPNLKTAALIGCVQTAGLVYSGLTQITDDRGYKVNKSYLINQVKFIEGDMQSLKEGLTMGSGSPTLTITDPGATKLLIEQKALMDLIKGYSNQLGTPALTSIKASFDEYVSEVVVRNNAVTHYNTIVTSLLNLYGTMESQTKQLAILSRTDLADIDPDFPGLATFVEQAYMDTATGALKVLYRTERAFAFWSLGANVSFASALGQGGLTSPGLSSRFKSYYLKILSQYDSAIEGINNQSQAFGSAGQGQASGDRSPIKVLLDKGQLRQLLDKKVVYVPLTEAYPETMEEDNAFSDCADVRLSNVRFYCEGAQTADGLLTISLQHTGTETIVDTYGNPHTFSHNMLNLKFQYHLETKQIQTDGDVGSAVNGQLAPPGPFTGWFVKVSEVWNDSPDLSNVTNAWFEFSGWSKSFGLGV